MKVKRGLLFFIAVLYFNCTFGQTVEWGQNVNIETIVNLKSGDFKPNQEFIIIVKPDNDSVSIDKLIIGTAGLSDTISGQDLDGIKQEVEDSIVLNLHTYLAPLITNGTTFAFGSPENRIDFEIRLENTSSSQTKIIKYKFIGSAVTRTGPIPDIFTIMLLDSYIPEASIIAKGKWPSYISENPVNYRVALDFTHSFSEISFWKRNDKTSKYVSKSHLRPKYLDNISLSILNYHLKYDSITVQTVFESFNLEDKSVFESNAAKANPGGAKKSETEGDSTSLNAASSESTANENREYLNQQKELVRSILNKLDSDLQIYSNRLTNSLIDQLVWKNDLDYINIQLKKSIQLTDFSVSGLKKKLGELTINYTVAGVDEEINSILRNYAQINSYSILTSAPVQVQNKDQLTYNLAFYKDGKKVEEQPYRFPIQCGFKIDFSTGFAYSSLGNETYHFVSTSPKSDTTYYKDDYFVTTDSILSITETNQNKIQLKSNDINIGVTALAHFYPRTGSMFNIGGTFGFSFNTEADFNFLLGGSIMLGQQQRFIFSGGLAVGKMDVLNPKYDINNDFFTDQEAAALSEDQLTIKEWKTNGFFISVTYNLGGATLDGKK